MNLCHILVSSTVPTIEYNKHSSIILTSSYLSGVSLMILSEVNWSFDPLHHVWMTWKSINCFIDTFDKPPHWSIKMFLRFLQKHEDVSINSFFSLHFHCISLHFICFCFFAFLGVM